MALSTGHHDIQSVHIGGKKISVIPFGQAHCKKCGQPIWWGKNLARKFLPPFANGDYTAWHSCNAATSTGTIVDDITHEEIQQAQEALAAIEKAQDCSALCIDELINNIISLCERIQNVRPAV